MSFWALERPECEGGRRLGQTRETDLLGRLNNNGAPALLAFNPDGNGKTLSEAFCLYHKLDTSGRRHRVRKTLPD